MNAAYSCPPTEGYADDNSRLDTTKAATNTPEFWNSSL